MKKLSKLLILSLLSTKILAQSTALEPNKVKIDNNNEFGTLFGSMALRNTHPNSKPVLYFWDTPTNTTTGFIGASITPNTFGIFSSNTLILGSLLGNITVSSAGNTGIGTSNPTTKFEVNGFSKLGSDAPAIKIKKLTNGCTTSANSGFPSGEISLTHGITPNKILKVEALVEYATNFWVKDGNDLFGYEFDIYITNTTISLRNLSGSASSEIRSKPCKILITYEE